MNFDKVNKTAYALIVISLLVTLLPLALHGAGLIGDWTAGISFFAIGSAWFLFWYTKGRKLL